MNLTSAQLTSLGMALGVCFVAYKFVGNPAVKTAALAVAAVIVAKRAPVIGAALS